MITTLDKDIFILLVAAFLWAVVVACAVSSILSRSLDPKTRRFWIVMVVFLPPLGLLAYLPFAVDYSKVLRDWMKRFTPAEKSSR